MFREPVIRRRSKRDYRAVAIWTVVAPFFLALFTLAIIGLNTIIEG